MPVCQKAEVPDFDESAGQDMEEESPQEFGRVQGQELLSVAVTGISPAEGHLPVLEADQSAVGNRHAMSVAGQVLDHVPRAGKGATCVHDPVSTAEMAHQSMERGWVEERLECALQAELLFTEGCAEDGEELASKHAAEDLEGWEKAFAARNPARLVGTDATGRDHAVQVRMRQQLLIPKCARRRVRQSARPDGAGLRRWSVRSQKPRGTECVDHFRILQGQHRQFVRQGEHQMAIGNRQQIAALGGEPFFTGAGLALGAMPIAAGVEYDGIALLHSGFVVCWACSAVWR